MCNEIAQETKKLQIINHKLRRMMKTDPEIKSERI